MSYTEVFIQDNRVDLTFIKTHNKQVTPLGE